MLGRRSLVRRRNMGDGPKHDQTIERPGTHHLVRDPTVRRLVLVVQHTQPHLIGRQGFQEGRDGVAPLALGVDHKLVAGGVDLKDDKGRLTRSEFGNGGVHVRAERHAALGGHNYTAPVQYSTVQYSLL